MSHIYRKQRAQTYRHRQIESAKLTSSRLDKSSYSASQQNYQHQNRPDQGSIPIEYYFNGTQKRKIIKNLIDSYFQTNPEHINKRLKKPESPILGDKRARLLIPYAEKSKQLKNDAKGADSVTNKPVLGLNRMAKTLDIKFFSNRSHISQTSNDLPIIEQIVDDRQPKRPHSEQKARYISSPITLKRRQSAGYVNANQGTLNNNSSLLNSSDVPLEEMESLTSSFVLSNQTTLFSRVNVQSYSKQCRYYNFAYSKQEVIKSFNTQGLFLLAKEIKLKKHGAKTLWSIPPHLTRQLVLQPHEPLSRELYSKVSKLHGDKTVQIIFPHEVYLGLFQNNCEWLKDVIIELCKQLIEIKNKIIINKIIIDNICRVGEKKIRIIDWSASGLRESVTNLDKVSMVKITQPTLNEPNDNRKLDFNAMKWICPPEYLAPQIIRHLQSGHFDDESVWDNPSASDTWSLGLLIFQILTLIPLNAQDRHTIKGRPYSRRGLFYMKQLSLMELGRKQKFFANEAIRILRKQCGDFLQKVDKRVIQVMEKMLRFDRRLRIGPEEAINILSK